MYMNMPSLPLDEATLDQYRTNAHKAFSGEQLDKALRRVCPDMYQTANLTEEHTGRADNTGLYPMRLDMDHQRATLEPGWRIVRFPACLPALVTEIDEVDQDQWETTTHRLNSYGGCDSIAAFMALAGEQLAASPRRFMLAFAPLDGNEVTRDTTRAYIRQDHRVAIPAVVWRYHVYELVNEGEFYPDADQKFELFGMDMRGETVDADVLSNNFTR